MYGRDKITYYMIGQENDGLVVVSAIDSSVLEQAKCLALKLALPFQYFESVQKRSDGFFLLVTLKGIELYYCEDISMKPLRIDFTHGAVGFRYRMGGGRKQALAKAVGLKKGKTPRVLDATAGLAKDAFVLAGLGCSVCMLERSKILVTLVQDAMQRARSHLAIADIIQTRLTMVNVDAITYLKNLPVSDIFQVIYIDPMYPASERKNKALVKKEMRILRALIGDDVDVNDLFQLALQKAVQRVVVKRPKYADSLAGAMPSLYIESKNTRFDVYLV